MIFSLFFVLLISISTKGFTVSNGKTSYVKSLRLQPVVSHSSPQTFSSSTTRFRSTELSMAKGDGDKNPFYKGQDAYQILDVPRGSDLKDIKTRYRKAVSTWHPDKFPDDDVKKEEGNQRMEKINRAWYCLGDEDRRRRYDQYGEEGVGSSASSEEQIKAAGSPMGQGGFGGGGGQSVDVNDISDIFDAFFGGVSGGGGQRGGGQQRGGQQQQRQRNANAPIAGEDMQVEVEIPFMTGLFGGSEKIKIRRMEECGTCTGSGVKPGAKVKGCSVCAGQGVVNNMQRTPFGVFNNVQTCPQCRGSGQEVEDYCAGCKGKGATTETREVMLRIPSGVEAGVTLRVRDSGNAGKRGGPRGDLFVLLQVKKDAKFQRSGIDILTNEEISYFDAILGTTISADTVDGKMDVKVPSGTQPEQKIRIRSKGAPKLGSEIRGDAFITVKVKIPTNLQGKERELIEEIAELSGKDKKGGFFGNFGV